MCCLKHLFIFILTNFFFSFSGHTQTNLVRYGEVWNDIDGHPINAHGGCVVRFEGLYYWFGEIKKGKTIRVEKTKNWENYRVSAGGVSCYSSKDLLYWKYEGISLAPETKDSSNELFIGRVIERPKVIYNEQTHQFVLWAHVDTDDYSFAQVGVATSNSITGPYKYIGSFRPNNAMSRDFTVFKDTDGKAYLISTTDNNSTLLISELSDDYVQTTGKFKRIMINQYREAPAMVKFNQKYYLITSGCSGWDANAADYAMADNIMGEWQQKGNPCIGEDANKTYHAQGNFILTIEGRPTSYLFMADRWNKTNLEDSRYLWLPLYFEGDRMKIVW